MEEGSKIPIPLNKNFQKNDISDNGDSHLKVITPCVSNITSSLNRITKSFTKLHINYGTTKLESDVIEDEKCHAGNIQNIIATMGLILIQPLLPNLLYLGKIDDIFGSVNEPMYIVYPTLEKINILNIGDRVYFHPNNPNTQFIINGVTVAYSTIFRKSQVNIDRHVDRKRENRKRGNKN
ncbi:hypothetical protein KPH14_007467 [Odynerus spinipes]|uniref:H/ACA ribonucleoprotein complex subunit n=1 Tax=Odynerus spinipes TaxID=1348599 RepID=A0AAD9VIR7_9HYME|nr:hypothetical protein KPH14_007467 [Odynerus spinipes]